MAETMTAEDAIARVADQYAALVEGLYIADPMGGAPVALGPIPAGDFELRSETDSTFVIAHDPLTGVVVKATVGRASGLVQFAPLALAVE